MLSSIDCIESLNDLQNRFVICPIDKASSNIAFACKRFYVQVLVKELGLIGAEGSATYERVQEATDEIVDRDSKTLKNKYSLQVPEDCMKLPRIYWMPKLHKNHIKFRFIIAAPSCSIKPLSSI